MPRTLANAADLEALRQRILTLTPGDRPRWGSMTTGQMICHMTDALLYTLHQRPLEPHIPSTLPPGIYKWLALYFPRKWPQDVPTPPGLKQGEGGTPPTEFAGDREALLQALAAFAANQGNWAPHPLFAEMTTPKWRRWGWLHTDHHLRQFGR
ncbi:DUF1569 domain-containing protein [Terriglobus tenax]|uniref:DUF1569 domain-containing protein n=1 Tax=Terriglobus tenax TaxID=1111115 RepID=UPI0021E002E4|nr:DUF1569 domain-containing protein [Terriglobus tenax]